MIVLMTLIGFLALGYWGGFIHEVRVKGASCVSRTDLTKGVHVHQTFLLTMDKAAFKKTMAERFSCIEDIRVRPALGAIEVEVLPRETILLLSAIPVSVDLRVNDEALIASLSALPVGSSFGLSREGVVVAAPNESASFPKVEYIGRIAAGERIALLAAIPWQSALDAVRRISNNVTRVLVVEESLVVLLHRPFDSTQVFDSEAQTRGGLRPEPTFLFFPLKDDLVSKVEESERMLNLLEQDKKRVTRLDLRFSRPVVRYAPSH